MDLLFLILGLAVGAALGYFIANRKGAGAQIDFNHWVEKSVLEAEKQQRHELQKRNDQLQQQVLGLNSENAGLKSRLQSLQEKLEEQKDELNRLNERFKNEFQVLANEILEEKSKKFVDINNEKLEILLNPLKEKITAFEKQVAEAYEKETKEKTALKFELDKIVEMNRKMSEEAERLTNALKGDSKYQGDWGEIQLERILERAGLEEGIHFETQGNYKNEQGQNIRPDIIIKLPEDKHLILDAKVSLTAYERYYNAESDLEKEQHLKEHVQSLLGHIQGLSGKNYQNIGINQPDYVMLFVPLEPALTLALKANPGLFDKALEKNIVLVSTSTLLATLRTIAFIWKQDNQQKNVQDIARESGALYDKFVGFMEDLTNVGRKIDDAKGEYQQAMKKLYTSSQKGGTIIGRIERIKKLGADSNKSLDARILERLGDE